jgi:hypothetical protein
MIGSCQTTPVNDSFGCRRVGTDPLGRISILLSSAFVAWRDDRSRMPASQARLTAS